MPGPTKLPVIGPWIAKIGAISSILATPCNVTPTIFVEAFFYAAPNMIWSLFKPDPIDTKLEFAGRPHGRPRRSRQMKEAEKRALGTFGNGKYSSFAWEVNDLAQRVGWYLMIADVAIDNALLWTSTAYKWSGCPTGTTALSGKWNAGTTFIGTGGLINPHIIHWDGAAPPIGAGPAGVYIPPNLPFSMGVTLECGPPSDGSPLTGYIDEVLIVNTLAPSGQKVIGRGSTPLFDPLHNTKIAAHVRPRWGQGAMNLTVYARAWGGKFSITGGNWNLQTGLDLGLFPDP